jgi:hypothetical protein
MPTIKTAKAIPNDIISYSVNSRKSKGFTQAHPLSEDIDYRLPSGNAERRSALFDCKLWGGVFCQPKKAENFAKNLPKLAKTCQNSDPLIYPLQNFTPLFLTMQNCSKMP